MRISGGSREASDLASGEGEALAISRQMARARIELATPRFSVVHRPRKAGHGWGRKGKKRLQTGENSLPENLRLFPCECAVVDLW